MTQKLSETKVSQRSGIEAFQLQILCEYLEDKIIKGEIPNNRIEPQHFADKINDIYEGYYERLIEKLNPEVQHAAQLLIEEKLIFEDYKTGEARRLGVDSGVLLNEKGITQTLLNQLESTFLLRRESTSTGGFNYEVSHDTMIAPILKFKRERKTIEDNKRLEWEYIEKERLKNKILIERQRKISFLFSGTYIFMAFLWFFMLLHKKQEENNSLRIDLLRIEMQTKSPKINLETSPEYLYILSKSKRQQNMIYVEGIILIIGLMIIYWLVYRMFEQSFNREKGDNWNSDKS